LKSSLHKMPEMVPSQRPSNQGEGLFQQQQDQGEDQGSLIQHHRGSSQGHDQGLHLQHLAHRRSSQGHGISSQSWEGEVKNAENAEHPVDLQKQKDIKEEINVKVEEQKKDKKVVSVVPPSTQYQSQTLKVRTNIVESKRSWIKDYHNFGNQVTPPLESTVSSTLTTNSLEKTPLVIPSLTKAKEEWMNVRRTEGSIPGRSQSRDGGVWSASSFHLPASRERRSSLASPGYGKAASPGYRELKDAVLFPTGTSMGNIEATREGREKEQRINFLPGRERDSWTREGAPRESLPRPHLTTSRPESLVREGGFPSAGRWTDAAPAPGGAGGAGPRRTPHTPPILQHHGGHMEHPHFIPPMEALYLDHLALPIRPTPQRPPGLQQRPDYLPYPHQPQHPLNQQFSDHQAAHFRQLAARRRQEQERFFHHEFMKTSRSATERQARGPDIVGQEAKSLHVATSPQIYDSLKKTSLTDEKCDNCGKEANFMCSACKGAHYCSLECQKERWPSHCRACLENTK